MITSGNFIQAVMPVIQQYAAEFDLHIESIAGGQACLEANFGTSELATKANNFFGRKHRDGFNAYYKTTKERMPVPEDYVLDNPDEVFEPWYTHPYSIELQSKGFTPIEDRPDWYTKSLPFNHYDTWEDGVKDYFWNIATRDVYADAREVLPDKVACLAAIGSHYASDDSYQVKVQNIIDREALYQYDI